MGELQTKVTFADKHILADFRAIKYNLDNSMVRQVIDTDIVTKITTVHVFTDDGHGNGNLLYKFDLE